MQIIYKKCIIFVFFIANSELSNLRHIVRISGSKESDKYYIHVIFRAML